MAVPPARAAVAVPDFAPDLFPDLVPDFTADAVLTPVLAPGFAAAPVPGLLPAATRSFEPAFETVAPDFAGGWALAFAVWASAAGGALALPSLASGCAPGTSES